MNRLIVLLFVLLLRITLYAQPADTLYLLQVKAPPVYHVEMKTDLGDLIIEINKAWAPLAADRFFQLVKSKFYDNSRLFRSNLKYLQFGIANDSAVNAFWERHPIQDEPVKQLNTKGTISFAMGGPNTRTTSVYFNKIDNPKLDTIQQATGFPGFGKIISGDSLLVKIDNKYVDSVVFKQWDLMMVKGNAYTDQVLPGLHRILSIKLIKYKSKHPARRTGVLQ